MHIPISIEAGSFLGATVGALGLYFGLAKTPDKLLGPSISGIQQAVKFFNQLYCYV